MGRYTLTQAGWSNYTKTYCKEVEREINAATFTCTIGHTFYSAVILCNINQFHSFVYHLHENGCYGFNAIYSNINRVKASTSNLLKGREESF